MDKKNTAIFILIIFLAAAVIVGGIIFSRIQPEIYSGSESENQVPAEYSIQPVSAEDHILGNPNADVILIEYSDLLCQHCKDFHPTMNRLLQEYGKSGDFAWVYRHFPAVDAISGEKTMSRVAAVASECVNSLSGAEAFWDFINGVFTDLPDDFSELDLRNLALNIGVAEEDYDKCIVDDRFETKIKRDIADGLEIYKHNPNFGTPYNIIVTKTGEQIEVVGAQPYEIIEQIIQQHSFPDSI